MFELLLCGFLSYRNAQLAKLKGQNTVVWVILTIVAYLIAYIIGAVLLVMMLFKGPWTPEGMTAFLMEKPLLMITFMFFGIGGYLLIRSILERMPNAEQKD